MNTSLDANLIASLAENPACAAMLSALIGGRALTAHELARATSTTVEAARHHLSTLQTAGVVALRRQGPHRYFELAGDAVKRQLAGMSGPTAPHASARIVTGPKDRLLRQARVCYGHLAGPRAVRLFDNLVERCVIAADGEVLRLSTAGETFVSDFGIDLAALQIARHPPCKTCLDWSERRSHLAGPLGAAMLNRITSLGWATGDPNSRLITFSKTGEAAFDAQFAA